MDPAACQVETQTLYGYGEANPKLCDASLERCFVDFDAIQSQLMRVSIGLGVAPKGFAELRYRGLELRGFLDVAPVVVFPRTELRLGGFFRPRSVAIVSGSPGKLMVRGDPGSGVVTDRSLAAEVACDEVSWSQDIWEEPAQIEERLGAKGKGEYVRVAARTQLMASPGGERVATIEPGAETLVSAYQTQNGARFITMWSEGGDVFGWVRKADLVSVATGSGWGSSGGGRGFAPIKTEWHGYRCKHDVPILARIHGALLEAGRVAAGSVFSVEGEPAPGLLGLVVRHQRYSDFGDPPVFRTPERIRLTEGATLAVERAVVRDCERRVPGEP